MSAPLKFLTVFVLVFGIGISSPISSKIDPKLQCAVCQFFQASNFSANAQACNQKCATLSDCEIVEILQSEIKKTSTSDKSHFSNLNLKLEEHSAKCLVNRELQLFNVDISSNTCTMCFLIYDTLKYINYNLLDSPMLGEIKAAILEACNFINQDLCEALFEVDTFGAIIQGLKDSLGGFYDAIGVQGFGCPAYNDLFTKC